jgi:hypothetical protein
MAAGFISEWWPASNRNGGRLHVGIPGRNKSESAIAETYVEVQAVPISGDEWEHPDIHRNPALIRAIKRDGMVLESQNDQQNSQQSCPVR